MPSCIFMKGALQMAKDPEVPFLDFDLGPEEAEFSTSYFIHCVQCDVAVTDCNACDNHPEVIECILENLTDYVHMAIFLEDTKTPWGRGVDYEVSSCGNRLDLRALRHHATHKLVGLDEYHNYIDKKCTGCNSRHCGPWSAGKKCCPDCSHVIDYYHPDRKHIQP